MTLDYEEACFLYNEEHYSQAYNIFMKLANDNHIYAQNFLASMLIQGEGVNKDEENGYLWYKKAAEGGDPQSQYNYGSYCLAQGLIEEGVSYVEQSFKQDYPSAICQIAIMKANGEYGFLKNNQEAIELMEKALIMGEGDITTRLLKTYRNEYGLIKTISYFFSNFKKLNIDVAKTRREA